MVSDKVLYDSAVMWMQQGNAEFAEALIGAMKGDASVSPLASGTMKAAVLMANGGASELDEAGELLTYLAMDHGDDYMLWIKASDLAMMRGNPVESEKAAKVAEKIDPKNSLALIKRFNALNASGRYEDALSVINSAVSIDPSPSNKMTLGIQMMLMASERGEECLIDHAAVDMYASRYPDNKSDPQSKTVLLEQGVGDVLMMLPYMSIVSDQDGEVVGDNRHRDVIRFLKPIESITASERLMGNGVWMFDAPKMLGRKSDYAGYKDVVAFDIRETTSHYDHVFSAFKDRTLFCFRGNPAHPNDKFRSIPFDTVKPYIDGHAKDLVVIGHHLTPQQQQYCISKGALVWDAIGIMPMASIVQSCKRVITVDTAVGHMAGIMGNPAKIMLSTLVDWRWGTTLTSNFRYPSVELVRQKSFNQWGDVLSEAFDE